LKESGFSQHTNWHWEFDEVRRDLVAANDISGMYESCAAPLLTEILKELPISKPSEAGPIYYLHIIRAHTTGGWLAGYFTPFGLESGKSWLVSVENASLIEACAQLLLKLKEVDGSQ
jgi:hypothetical protein